MGDGLQKEGAEQNRSEAPPPGGKNVDRTDLAAAFAVVLGRPPDDVENQLSYWKTRSLPELLRVLSNSEEFANINNILISEGVLASRETLSSAELRLADIWLARHKPGRVPSLRIGWSDLLLTAVTSVELVALGGPVLSSEALMVLKGIVEARRGAQDRFEEVVRFDAEAFVAVPGHGQYCDSDGELDFSAVIGRHADSPVMLPLFTEGLSAQRKPGPLTLGDWLGETQSAALAGSLTHWLWDEATYRRNRSVASRCLDAELPDELAFLDFLAVGDRAGVAPHPLFCHHAYRTLNRGDGFGEGANFRHFVMEGEPGDVRTSALFDPEFYLSRQPHVRAEIAAGLFRSPLEHFVRVGLSAGYDFSPDFDRHFYFASNPDVGQAVAEGGIPSLEWHYLFVGARENRAPNPYFNAWYYVSRYPFVADEMARLGIATSLEHFILIGQARGWVANPPLVERAVAPDDGRALFEKRGRRAYVEILDGGIAIPAATTPRLSVVVPVSNQADLTAGFLKSAAFAIEVLGSRRNIETEILVVDSDSQDHTTMLMAALPSVAVVRPSVPFSFPAAVNAGVAKARGDLVLVVNNDIEFQPDAFDRAVAILDDDESVGLVGAKIILPNETVQEVGASVDRLGNTHGMGRGADAFLATNNRRLIVDYASGCFIAFRRADFDALSGFDESFSPGYYEDVDFALRMKRDLDKATVVDTGLAVVHYENASFAKGRPATANMSGALRNRLLLKTRHAALFRGMRVAADADRAVRSRRALFGGSRVLVVQDMIASATMGPSVARQAAILDAFTQLGVGFDILAMRAGKRIDNYKDPRATVFRNWVPGQSLQEILQRQGAGYDYVWVCGVENLARHASVLAQARRDSGLKVICDADVLGCQEKAERSQRVTGVADDAGVLAALAEKLVHPLDVDQWVTVDDRDRELIESLGLGPVVEIGCGLSPHQEAGVAPPLSARRRILFTVAASSQEGVVLDGLGWLLSEVWPRLSGMAETKLTIVGELEAGFADGLRRRFADRIDGIDTVDQTPMAQLYDETRVAVLTDRLAATGFLAVAEAARAGVPTVMTDLVADRLGLGGDPTVAWARRDDGGRQYAEWLSRLYTQDKAWRAQLKKQHLAIASKFETHPIVDQVKASLDSISS